MSDPTDWSTWKPHSKQKIEPVPKKRNSIMEGRNMPIRLDSDSQQEFDAIKEHYGLLHDSDTFRLILHRYYMDVFKKEGV